MKKLLVLLTAVLLLALSVGCADVTLTPQSKSGNSPSSVNLITKEQAKEIAYNHAQTSDSFVWDFEIDLDKNHKGVFYEIEFKAAGYEYEYDIHAETGKISRYRKERID